MTNQDLTKKIRNAKIRRNVFGAVAGAGFLFGTYFLGDSIYHTNNTPKGYEKWQNAKQRVEKIKDARQDNLKTFNENVNYIPLDKELRQAYEKQDSLYNEALGEALTKVHNLEKPQYIEYKKEEKENQTNIPLGTLPGYFTFLMAGTLSANENREVNELKNKQVGNK